MDAAETMQVAELTKRIRNQEQSIASLQSSLDEALKAKGEAVQQLVDFRREYEAWCALKITELRELQEGWKKREAAHAEALRDLSSEIGGHKLVADSERDRRKALQARVDEVEARLAVREADLHAAEARVQELLQVKPN